MVKIENILANDIAKTLLIPLWCCATPCKANPVAAYDPKAVEVIQTLDYDFSEIRNSFKEYGQVCCLAREINIDRAVGEFVAAHPEGSIVNLGCGLNTAAYRADLAGCSWYDLDFPEVIRARQQIFPPVERRNTIAKSLLDSSWMAEVCFDADKGILFIAGGVFHYFEEKVICPVVALMAQCFPGGRLFFDAVSRMGMKLANRYVRKSGNKGADMHFAVDNPEILRNLSDKLENIEAFPFFKGLDRKGLTFATRFNIFFVELFYMLKYIAIDFKR
jgi:O-methyltransferase involved in polyketide biosynthesis